MSWAPGERPPRPYKGWTTPSLVHGHQALSRYHKVHMPTNHHQHPMCLEVTTLQWFIILSPGKRLLWSAFTLAFYGFLRASEFATSNLSWSNIQLNTDNITLIIRITITILARLYDHHSCHWHIHMSCPSSQSLCSTNPTASTIWAFV